MAAPKSNKGAFVVTINSEGLEDITKDYLSALDSKSRKKVIRVATLSALDAVKKYYSDKGRNLWVRPGGPTHGPGRKPTQWWRGTANGWTAQNITSRSSDLVNKTIGLSHKVTGGTIKPIRAKRLTIPLIPQAHGLTAKGYSNTIAPLFPLKNVLASKTKEGSKEGFKAVFALRKSVTQKPWKGALPPEKKYMQAYEETLLDAIIAELEGL